MTTLIRYIEPQPIMELTPLPVDEAMEGGLDLAADAAIGAYAPLPPSARSSTAGGAGGSSSKKPEGHTSFVTLLSESARPHVDALRALVRSNYRALDALLLEYTGHARLLYENETFDAESMRPLAHHSRAEGLDEFRQKMHELDAQIALYQAMYDDVHVGIFAADACALRERLTPAPQRSLAAVRVLLPRLADEQSSSILREVQDADGFLIASPIRCRADCP